MNVPTGVNLAQNTEAPLLGILATPLVLFGSPLIAANILLLVGMPISATAAFLVLRRWRVWQPGAALGGLLYGFSPYMVGQTQAHPQLAFLPIPPLIVGVVVSIVRDRRSPLRRGILLGVLVAFQYLISPELVASLGLFAAIALVLMALRRRREVSAALHSSARALGIASATCFVVLAYPVWLLIGGPQHVKGSTYTFANPFHNDLLSLVVPGPLQRAPVDFHTTVSRLVGGIGSTEAGGYVGIGLIAVIGYVVWRSRRSPRMQLTAALLLVSVLLSFGPYLIVNGTDTHIPLPYWVLGQLPFLNDLLPSRFNFETGALIAATIAFGLDDLREEGIWRRALHAARSPTSARNTAIAGVITITVLVVLTQFPRWPYTSPPMVALPPSVVRSIPGNDPIALTYPYSTAYIIEPMFWQASSDYRFRIFGGYVYVRGADGRGAVSPGRMQPHDLQRFLASQEGVHWYGRASSSVTPALIASTRWAVSHYGVRLVIVDRSLQGSGPVVALFTDALGLPTTASGSYAIWADWHGVG